jgi:hypothetical protein
MMHEIQAYLSFVEKSWAFMRSLSPKVAREHATTPDLKVNHCTKGQLFSRNQSPVARKAGIQKIGHF